MPVSQLTGIICELTRILESPEIEPDPRHVFAAALRDLRIRLAAVATHAQVARWIDAMRGYLTATLWESANRQDSIIPSLSEYTAMRLHSGAMKPSVALLDVADGYELPVPMLARPEVRALIEMTCLLGGWDNDIFSYAKETDRVGDGQNLIDVITHQEQCSSEQSLERAVAMRDRVVCLFLRLRHQTLTDASPNLRSYVNSLGYWVAIQLESGLRCGRAGLPADVGCLTAGAWWRGGGGGPLRRYGGAVAGGSQGPSVNSQVRASRASMPHLAVVDR